VFLDVAGRSCFNICCCSCREEPLAAPPLHLCTRADRVYLQVLRQNNLSASHRGGEGGAGASHPCSGELLGSWYQCGAL